MKRERKKQIRRQGELGMRKRNKRERQREKKGKVKNKKCCLAGHSNQKYICCDILFRHPELLVLFNKYINLSIYLYYHIHLLPNWTHFLKIGFVVAKGTKQIKKGKLYEKSLMHTKIFNTFFKIWVQSRKGASLRLPINL